MVRSAKPHPRARALLLIAVMVVIAFALFNHHAAKVDIKERVANVVALDNNTVRVYIVWSNVGKVAGSLACTMDTTVTNQFGDQVNIEVNTTNTNGAVRPGQSQDLYQDIGVNAGDAPYIRPQNIKLSC